jgi:hypothetical protein
MLGHPEHLLLGHGVSSIVGDPECQPSPSVPSQTALACGASLEPGAYVFSHEPDTSKPIRPDGVSHRFRKASARRRTR